MEHKELIEVLQKDWHVGKKESETRVKTVAQLIADTSTVMRSVAIAGFGMFRPIKIEERVEVNSANHIALLLPPEMHITYTQNIVGDRTHTLTEDDLANLLAKRCSIEKSVAIQVVTSLFAQIATVCNRGEQVVINNLGTFAPATEQNERTFAPDKQMREWVNAPFASFVPEPIEEEMAEQPLSSPPPIVEPTEEEAEIETEKQPKIEPITPTDVKEREREEQKQKLNIALLSRFIIVGAIVAVGGYMILTPQVETPIAETPQQKPIVTEKVDTTPAIVERQETIVETKVEPIIVDTIREKVYMATLARKYYGNKAFWIYIYEENKATIKNPNVVLPNTPVVIPPKEKYGIDANDPASVERAEKHAQEILNSL